jgi:hypothetical protein
MNVRGEGVKVWQVVLCALGFLLLLPQWSFACSCRGARNFEDLAARAPVLVRAAVVRPLEGAPGAESVVFKVLRVERGARQGQVLRVMLFETPCDDPDVHVKLAALKAGDEWVLALGTRDARDPEDGIATYTFTAACVPQFTPVSGGYVGSVAADEYLHRFESKPSADDLAVPPRIVAPQDAR